MSEFANYPQWYKFWESIPPVIQFKKRKNKRGYEIETSSVDYL